MKSLSKYIYESFNNGIIKDLQIGETIYIWCSSKSNELVSAKISNIDKAEKANNFWIELDKKVFGGEGIDYGLRPNGAQGMRDHDIKYANIETDEIYNGILYGKGINLPVIFGRSKEDIKEMIDSSYGIKLKEMQEKAEEIYKQYEDQMLKINNLIEKIKID
ncbi:MAG: hypothetical protein J1F35_05625 [Erysipelotrichales bacterium]|nr:hypothetical protein [Erysipelotrichales bacterium]